MLIVLSCHPESTPEGALQLLQVDFPMSPSIVDHVESVGCHPTLPYLLLDPIESEEQV